VDPQGTLDGHDVLFKDTGRQQIEALQALATADVEERLGIDAVASKSERLECYRAEEKNYPVC